MGGTNDKRALERLINEIVDCAVSVGMSEAMKGFGAFTEIDSISMTAMRRSISQKRAQILGHFYATATPPADAALADALEHAGTRAEFHPDSEIAVLCRNAAASLRARAVPECISQHDHRAVMSDSPIDFARGWNNCVAAMLAASKRGE